MKFWTQPSTLTADLRGELGAGYVEHVPGIAAAISAAAEGPGLDGLAALAALRPDPAGLHADDASETPAQMLAVARQGLRARIDLADARFDQEARSTADRIRAVTTLITSLGARFDDQATGLAATQSDLSRLERVTAEAAQANVDAITQLRAIVTDPKTGLEKTRTALTSLTELVATQNTAAIRRLDLLEGQVNDPATGLAWARGAIADLGRIDIHRSQIMAAARWTKPVK